MCSRDSCQKLINLPPLFPHLGANMPLCEILSDIPFLKKHKAFHYIAFSMKHLFHSSLLLTFLITSICQGKSPYDEVIKPFTNTYCVECHGNKKAKADLNMDVFQSEKDVSKKFRTWGHIVEFIELGEMPPEKSKQPTLEERDKVLAAINGILYEEALRGAGDPGIVLPRRLSKVEFDNSVSDLIGVRVHTTANFPPDPAGGEGFDNTGEALGMSPSLLKKYLEAAEIAASHMVLKPDGIDFSPFPVTSYNERKKLSEQAIIDFYNSHDVELRDYLFAAARLRGQQADVRGLDRKAFAKKEGLSPKYLKLVFETLEEAENQSGVMREIGELWKKVPALSGDPSVPKELLELVSYIRAARKAIFPIEPRLIRSNAGNWPIDQMNYRAKHAANRDQFDPSIFKTEIPLRFDKIRPPKDNDPENYFFLAKLETAIPESAGNYVIFKDPILTTRGSRSTKEQDIAKHQEESFRAFLEKHDPVLAGQLKFGKHPGGGQISPDSFVLKAPAELKIQLSNSLRIAANDRHLYMEVELDPKTSQEGAVHFYYNTRLEREEPNYNTSQLLAYRDSELAKNWSEAAKTFSNTFPNRFYYVDESRGLAAGFHLVEGFFRDDQPLMKKVLTDEQAQEINQLWKELHFVTNSAENLLRGFVWFERSERHVLQDPRFDFLRAEDPELVTPAMIDRFEKVYLDKMGIKRIEDTLEVEKPEEAKYVMIHGFFEDIRTGLVQRQKLLKQAEAKALAQLQRLAEQAYRRPLTSAEIQSQKILFQTLRNQGQDVETALRGTFASILLSPEFCFRYNEEATGSGIQPLSNDALATRLSYFLWSSIPDQELLQLVQSGKLNDAQVLRQQTNRMLKSPKMEAFAREFLGQWLRYRDFLQKDPLNAENFREYDDELRVAMITEPTKLTTWLINEDQPVTALLSSDVTFVNRRLARHYGGQFENKWRAGKPENDASWQRIEGIRELGRGGLPGMGIILTANSAGSRTSPVKRGFWTVHHLLGRHFPPPPADVPELPSDEKTSPKTIRDMLAEHRADPSCNQCHQHFDSLGLALEGFDPTGKLRTKDLAGRSIDNLATLPNGIETKGLPGLLDYLETERRDDFIKTLCKKFLGYALGRSVTLYDQPLLKEMEKNLAANDYRFSTLFETVVLSKQFRNQRGSDFANR